MLQFGKYSISIKFTRVLAVQMETTKKHIELLYLIWMIFLAYLAFAIVTFQIDGENAVK